MDKSLVKRAEIAKIFTGSVMSVEDICKQYIGLTLPKRHYLYKEAKQRIKDFDRLMGTYADDKEHAFNINFDARLGLMTIDMNLIAIDNDTEDMLMDPATVLVCLIDGENKKLS